jgi:hypothetical protein
MKYLHALTSKAVEATQDKGNPRILMKIIESLNRTGNFDTFLDITFLLLRVFKKI